MKIAYLTNRYGSASYTFIRTEVDHLRRRGHSILTFSVREPSAAEAVSEEVRREQALTEYFLPPRRLHIAVPRLLTSVLKMLAVAPLGFASALSLALRTSAPGVRARLMQIGYFVLACHLANRMRSHRVEHLHNHLGTSSASIATSSWR